jgi:hypothetical protein
VLDLEIDKCRDRFRNMASIELEADFVAHRAGVKKLLDTRQVSARYQPLDP